MLLHPPSSTLFPYTTLFRSESGVYFLQQLRDLKNRHATIGDVSGLGLALRIEVTKPDRFTPDKALTDRIFEAGLAGDIDRKSTRLNSSHQIISYAVFCLKKK